MPTDPAPSSPRPRPSDDPRDPSFWAPVRGDESLYRLEDSDHRLIESEVVYEGPVYAVTADHLTRPQDDRRIQRDTVKHPGAVAILPFLDPETIVLVRQYRHAFYGELLELPAGLLDPGEDPETAAQRELEEEIGYRAGRLVPTGDTFPAPGMTNERVWLYEAHDLTATQQQFDDDEHLEVVRISLAAALTALEAGIIRDCKSELALRRHLALTRTD